MPFSPISCRPVVRVLFLFECPCAWVGARAGSALRSALLLQNTLCPPFNGWGRAAAAPARECSLCEALLGACYSFSLSAYFGMLLALRQSLSGQPPRVIYLPFFSFLAEIATKL